ncbi:MAG: DEAD/DEAH box helicase family protein [Fibrobacteres bacterium]|nr:DEAD/DEAH box helicase family protein [Fibrobacterota bacterium]
MNVPDRNAPCHCGSGRKYKKCCMVSDAAKVASKLAEDLKARQEKARSALASAERKAAEAAAIAPPPVRTAPPQRHRQKLENRSSRVSAWLPSWFNDADTLSRIEAMARLAKGKWKDQEGYGRFGGWVQDKGSMPIRVEGSWDPPDLEGSCSECGSQERCVHIAAMARSLEGTSPSNEIGPHEETHPCVPVLAIRRWNFRQGKQVRRHDGARLSLRYGPKEIDEHDKTAMISWVAEAGPVRCPRDRQAEGAMRQRLEDLGWKMHDLTGLRKYHNFSLEGILDFLERDAPVLRQEGWVIEVDDGMGLTLLPIDSWSGTWTPGDDGWFGIGLSVSFAGKSIDLVDLCRRILSGSRLDAVLKSLREGQSLTVEVDGGCIRLPPERLLPIFSGLAFFLSGEGKGARVSPLMAARLGDFGLGDNSWQGIDRLAELRKKLSEVTAPLAVALPGSVKASLRPYQQTGLSWLQWLASHGFGGILADDMGLGKTLQTIAHIACEHKAGRMSAPALVVCPTSLTSNWADELARFAPGLQVLVLHGSDRHERRDQTDHAQVVITTYSLLARDEEWLISHPWHMVVFDEAQTLKNARTQARTVARAIQSTHKLALTGTPMENHLGELWSLFDLVVPGLLGTERHFGASVRNRIEKLGDMDLSARLRSVVSPFLLRRTKDAVASELPEKTEIVIHVDLDGKQRDLYETVRAVQDKRLRNLLAAQSLETSSIQILEALLRLRQTCCDPRLLPPELAKGCRVSAKIEWLARSLPEMVEEGRRILVFSQFTGFLDLAQELLSESGITFLRLDGSTADRGAVVRDFQSGKAPVFLLSLKAGGTGLNLTAADSVIFLDPWWNPAVEAQAMDRAHRIGQTKSVFVYRLVARGTVEEKILSLQTRKAELAASILEGGGAASLRFTSEDLAELMRPLR